ncbi:DUF4177 domain-containing protein [Oceanirhabdus sp. W0125-5]|uniref:DUF4177 domain-containing protein n=1 Tax=Oceanirhabdus sp. W0125-5 TaxID=2999116 RepID=UPI0022F324C0|nr:DUF4177 domain-containing protein [Oceanirhabdus sp. W0125-5]WBW95363.1 DUF4177 domain-containing protein [Oceanirhabdus sp. W0125-5]
MERNQEYEYRFIKVDLTTFATLKPKENYHGIIEEHARDGWRLVQIFSPAVGVGGFSKYFEIILERPITNRLSE